MNNSNGEKFKTGVNFTTGIRLQLSASNNLLSIWTVFIVIIILVIATGCKVGPNFQKPQTNLPQSFTAISLTNNQVVTTVSRTESLAEWWTNFNDPKLTDLIQRAIHTNLDLQIAKARIRQARASYRITKGGLLPGIGTSASYTRSYVENSARDEDLFSAGVDAIWELDIFGGTRRSIEAAQANIVSAIESLRDIQVSLAAEVALNYIQLRSIQQQIAISKENLNAQQQTANITRKRLGAGFASALDVANADAQTATTESQIPRLEAAERQTINALSFLLATTPGELLKELSEPAQIPDPPQLVSAGLPSDLLRRRPDIRRAEANLHAATARIGVAVSDLFPRFSLLGSFNFQETDFGRLFTDPTRTGSVGPRVSWQIFQGGAIKANVKLQEALKDEAFINYQKTVLNAIAEVENALVSIAREQEHSNALYRAVMANRRAVQLAVKLYTEGQTDFINVLNAQRSLLATEDALVQSRRNIATAVVSLYKAVGGGWLENTQAENNTPNVAQ